jgi:peptide/nickel transport system permease protein
MRAPDQVVAGGWGTFLSLPRGLAAAWRIVYRLAVEVAQLALVLVGISTVLFVLLRLSGDPVSLLLPADAPASALARLREELGLDRPIFEQYIRFLVGLARLDFGESIVFRRPAFEFALERIPATLELTTASVAFSLAVGLPLGMVAAVARQRLARVAAILVAVAGQSMPSYWLGVLLVLLFAVTFRVFPVSGRAGPESLVLPAVTLGLMLAGRVIRLVQAGIRKELSMDYVRTARGKGLGGKRVLLRHVMPNMLIPVIAVVGVDIGRLMGGAVITESIFAWPGVGRQLVTAVLQRDYPVAQAIVFLVAIFVLVINRASDLVVRVIDPRVRST